MQRINLNAFLDDPTVRMLINPLSSVGKKYSKKDKSGLSYFLQECCNIRGSANESRV